jgi:hypothetical protein
VNGGRDEFALTARGSNRSKEKNMNYYRDEFVVRVWILS